MNLERHLGIGLCLSFHPSSANLVAINPNNKQTPNRTSLTAAIGKHTTIFNTSYTPSIFGVSLRNGSTVDGAGMDNSSDPINSNGLRFGCRLWWFWDSVEEDCWLESLSWMVRISWGWSDGWEARSGQDRWRWSASAILWGCTDGEERLGIFLFFKENLEMEETGGCSGPWVVLEIRILSTFGLHVGLIYYM